MPDDSEVLETAPYTVVADEVRSGGKIYEAGSTVRLLDKAAKPLLAKKKIKPATVTAFKVCGNLRHGGRHYNAGKQIELTDWEADQAPVKAVIEPLAAKDVEPADGAK